MSIALYYAPSTRAGRVRWLLEELEAPHELRRVDMKAKSAELLAVSPLGKIPVMLVDGRPMLESTAMILYLADRFADRGLAPAIDAPERPAYLQWQVFVPVTLEPPLLDLWKPQGEAARAAAVERTQAALAVLADAIADGREFLLGDRFSAVDCAAGQVIGWARSAGQLEPFPQLLEYGRRVGARPAAKKARAD